MFRLFAVRCSSAVGNESTFTGWLRTHPHPTALLPSTAHTLLESKLESQEGEKAVASLRHRHRLTQELERGWGGFFLVLHARPLQKFH